MPPASRAPSSNDSKYSRKAREVTCSSASSRNHFIQGHRQVKREKAEAAAEAMLTLQSFSLGFAWATHRVEIVEGGFFRGIGVS